MQAVASRHIHRHTELRFQQELYVDQIQKAEFAVGVVVATDRDRNLPNDCCFLVCVAYLCYTCTIGT
jgi:hypothetical protein